MFNNTQANANQTIYAPASSIQKAGIIVIRVSGADVKKTIKYLGCDYLSPRHATLTKIHHPISKEPIDECIAIYYESPKSFTGEDVLELNIHGGMAVLDLTLEALSTIQNLRVAEPGEFTMRAFLNNKMDLAEVDGLHDLLNSTTAAQHKHALRQMSGELSDIYEGWRLTLLKIISHIEAYIDFPDEDIPKDLNKNINNEVLNLCQSIEKFLENSHRGSKLAEGLHIAIIGPTNAGKSSLLNKLAKKDVAIVSNIEGTTRDVIEVNMDISGYPVTIADTAGLRISKNKIEAEGIKRSLSRAQSADLKIILLDGTKKLNDNSLRLIDNNSLVVINKIDLMNTEVPIKISGHNTIAISTKTNEGIDKLLETITNFTKNFFISSNNAPLITKQRQRENLTKAHRSLRTFTLEQDLVLATEDLRMAAHYLGSITGRIDVESVLGEIFSNFCIGK
jgi:tRNA modification GTPase